MNTEPENKVINKSITRSIFKKRINVKLETKKKKKKNCLQSYSFTISANLLETIQRTKKVNTYLLPFAETLSSKMLERSLGGGRLCISFFGDVQAFELAGSKDSSNLAASLIAGEDLNLQQQRIK